MNIMSFSCEYSCSFRVVGLSEAELEIAKELVSEGYQYRTVQSHKNAEHKILVIVLSESVSANVLKNIIGCVSRIVSYGFVVSTCNSNESFIIDVPNYLVSLLKEVGGDLSFSYTCAGD